MIRVAHCAGFYFPDQVGGTEVYVQDLLAELGRRSVDGYVIAATDAGYKQYEWEGAQVTRYPSNWANLRSYAASPTAGLSRFQELVLERRPDIFHLHSWTSGAGLIHLTQIAQLGIPCVVTIHVASALCMRGSMLLLGVEACDGLIDEKRCARCWSELRGVPPPLAFAMSQLPRMSFEGGSRPKVLSRAATLLSARTRAAVHLHELHQMADLSRKIVVPSEWIHAGLLRNGIPPAKLAISRQGVDGALVREAATPGGKPPSQELVIGFIGRLEQYKGAHILIEAMARLSPELPIRLLVAGSGTDAQYLRKLTQVWAGNRRIEFLGPLSREEVPDFLRRLDVLAVPSNTMETGPLVVLEGQVFGLPVMGADLGGISERIRDGIDGWLLPFDDPREWAVAMQDAALNRSKVETFARNVRPPRTMADVAAEMADLYRGIVP
jgi:glycosyltransferase involved in cell wall biosynthesis